MTPRTAATAFRIVAVAEALLLGRPAGRHVREVRPRDHRAGRARSSARSTARIFVAYVVVALVAEPGAALVRRARRCSPWSAPSRRWPPCGSSGWPPATTSCRASRRFRPPDRRATRRRSLRSRSCPNPSCRPPPAPSWRAPPVCSARGGRRAWSPGSSGTAGSPGRPAAATCPSRTPTSSTGSGSISKTITAVVVMRLRDEGLLHLDDPLDRHLPGTPLGDRTIGQLLSHLAGASAESPGGWWERTPGGSLDDLAARAGRRRPRRGPAVPLLQPRVRPARRAGRPHARAPPGTTPSPPRCSRRWA